MRQLRDNMEKYSLTWINDRAENDPAAFIEACEAHYQAQITRVADDLAEKREKCPIVLLCGPSSSGKTTTADRLRRALHKKGVHAETISMDDYYLSRDTYDMPWDEENNVQDFESPLCMDLPMLHEHLEKLAKGEEISIPTFDFEQKMRTDVYKTLKLQKDEIVVIEGIHAFNEVIVGGLEKYAVGVYIALASSVDMGDWSLEPDQLRFCRRAVRDARFRSAPVDLTIRQWQSIRRGERMYIDPFREAAASHVIDSYLPYETCILMSRLRGRMDEYAQLLKNAGLSNVLRAADAFAEIDYLPYIPEASVLHEFID